MTGTLTTRGEGRKLSRLRGIVFEQQGAFVIVCLDRYLMSVAKSEDQVPREIERMVLGHITASLESGEEPFKGLPKAPQKYWQMYEGYRPAKQDLIPTPPPGLMASFPSLDFRAGTAVAAV